jgi:hypothetical protein
LKSASSHVFSGKIKALTLLFQQAQEYRWAGGGSGGEQ